MDLQSSAQILGYVAGALAALGTIYTYALRPPILFVKEFIQVLSKLDESLPVLMEISHQFKPNGGNSLRDVIDRIERDINASKARTKIRRSRNEQHFVSRGLEASPNHSHSPSFERSAFNDNLVAK